MKKFSQLFLCAAAGLMMFSCSSDEPANNGGNVNHVPGEPAYMTINLRSASMGGRSTTDGGFEYGSADEQNITSAQFFFFDADGVYVASAKPWNGGNAVKEENIEFRSNTVVILDNLTGTDYPSYVMTVLNAPDFTPASTMAATAAKTLEYYTKNGDKNMFVMSTSSYFGESDNHSDDFYYVTKIHPDNFSKEPVVADPSNVVNIYVERLAAKVELKTAADLKSEVAGDGTTIYPLTATVAGELNDGTAVGTTQLYVRFTNFGLSSTAKASYMSKSLEGWEATDEIFTTSNWNDAANFRSYWGKGVNYGMATPDVNTATWTDLDRAINSEYAYCNEHTNTAAFSAVLGNPTAVLVGAELVDKDGNALDNIVRYHGVLYLQNDFFAYTINSLNVGGKFDYYYVGSETKNTETTEEGETTTTITDYKQLDVTDLTLALVSANDGTTGSVYVEASALTLPEVAESKLYLKNGADYTEVTVDAALAAINENLKDYKGEGYKDGKMFYTIPVQHLGAIATETKTPTTADEGYYGVVRNHWYVLTINALEKIGHGVFNPGDDTVTGEELKPTDPEEFYYLAAQINVLSWKVVNQGVDL